VHGGHQQHHGLRRRLIALQHGLEQRAVAAVELPLVPAAVPAVPAAIAGSNTLSESLKWYSSCQRQTQYRSQHLHMAGINDAPPQCKPTSA
jgi:hypothetical protein